MSRILQIPNYLYPNIGGIEQTARDIMRAISKTGSVQKVICFNENAQKEDFICKRKETVKDIVDGVEVVRCGCFTKIASQSLSLTYPKQLRKMIKEFKPDIIIFHYPNPFVASILLPLLPENTKLILYWHLDITKQRILGKIFEGQTERLLRRANQIVATSPNYVTGSPYLSRYTEKIIVIPSCIDSDRLEPKTKHYKMAERIREENKGKYICFAVGRHVEYKGLKYLIEASKNLDDSFSVLIGGKGPLTDSLIRQAKEDNKVKFLGRISDDELIAYYIACDVVCFPSITKNEAFGLSLAEGMYFGKPAITFTIPGSGVNYVNLNGETGFEVENRNSQMYARELQILSKEASLAELLGAQAKQRIEKLFLFKSFERKIENLLNGI